jgi:hypothetical protein
VRTCRQGIVDYRPNYFSMFLKLKPYGTINKSFVLLPSPALVNSTL